MILLGMRDKVLSSDFIWLCSICHNCVEHCPQDVRFSEVMDAVGNIATREGYVHPSYATRAELIGRQGVLYEVSERENQRRQELGLPARATKFDDVGQIFDLTGLLELVRKDKEE
jgi:heterodisulfide reductase subunit C